MTFSLHVRIFQEKRNALMNSEINLKLINYMIGKINEVSAKRYEM